MKTIRVARALVPVVALFGLVTCGSSGSTGSGTGGAGGQAENAGGKTSAGGNGTIGSGGITGNGGSSGGGPRNCGPSGSGSGTCTTAESNAYSMCVTTACDSQYKTCLGPDYMKGTYAGSCGTYFQCQNKCACGDTACLVNCGLPAADCLTCLTGLDTCSSTCTAPACYGNTGGKSGGFGGISGGFGGISGGLGGIGGGATCADLLACCNQASATFKSTCMMAYTNAMASGDLACSIGLAGIKSLVCP